WLRSERQRASRNLRPSTTEVSRRLQSNLLNHRPARRSERSTGSTTRTTRHTVGDMRILLIGATGVLGAAVCEALVARDHEVLTVGRSGGDLRFDITDPAQVSELYERAGQVDAVVSAAGKVPYKSVLDLT